LSITPRLPLPPRARAEGTLKGLGKDWIIRRHNDIVLALGSYLPFIFPLAKGDKGEGNMKMKKTEREIGVK
jgi:hypothetical protein